MIREAQKRQREADSMITCKRVVTILIGLLWTGVAAAQPRQIFWTDSQEQKIYSGAADGSSFEEILTARDPAAFVLADTILYWANGLTHTINRSRPDGQMADTLVTGAERVIDLTHDQENGNLYWAEAGPDQSRIRRSNEDGTAVQTIISNAKQPSALAIDTSNAKIYWTDRESIHRANLDGSQVEVLLGGLARPEDLALDLEHEKLYWIADDKVQRANLNGSNVEAIQTDGDANSLTLDVANRTIYWAEAHTRIKQADLDGSSEEVVFKRVEDPDPYTVLEVDRISSLALDKGHLYWQEGGFPYFTAANIRRLDLQEGTMDTVFVGFAGPAGITVDPKSSQIYWTAGQGKVLRAHLDGSGIQELAEVPCGIGHLTDIVFDGVREKLYWGHMTDCPSYDIYRADLDGSAVEIVKGYHQPRGLALDAQQGVLYWTRDQPRALMRSGLDTLFETRRGEYITSDVSTPWGIGVSRETERVYWADSYRGTIERADPNGADRSVVLSDLQEPTDLALDVNGNRMYWLERESGKIRQATLEGSEAEDLFTGLAEPSYLALTFESSRILEAEGPVDLPKRLWLYQNYPNPFNPSTSIRFALSEAAHVSLVVFDLTGRQVAQLVDGPIHAGHHQINFDGSGLPSGLYFYQLQTRQKTLTRQMMLVK